MEDKYYQINTYNKNVCNITRLLSSDSVWNPIEAEGRIPFMFEGLLGERKT